MASASNLHLQSARPQVVPNETPQSMPYKMPQPITQDELVLFLSLRGRLYQLESQVEAAEQSIIQRLEEGAGVEPGDHTAAVVTNFRRNVSWKSVAERLASRFKLDGKAFTARVLAATRPTPSVSLGIN